MLAIIGGFPNETSESQRTRTIGKDVIEREAGSVEEGEETGAERPEGHRPGISIFDSPPLELFIFNASPLPAPAFRSMTARNDSSI